MISKSRKMWRDRKRSVLLHIRSSNVQGLEALRCSLRFWRFVCLFLLNLIGWHGSSISQGGRDKGHLFQLWEDLIPFSFWNTSVARDSICPWKWVWFGPPVTVPRCTGKKTNDTLSTKWTVLLSMWQHMQLFLWQPGEARFKLPFYYIMHQLSPGPEVVGALLHVPNPLIWGREILACNQLVGQ